MSRYKRIPVGASKTSALDLVDPGNLAFQGEVYAKPEYSAVPLRLGVFYTLNIGSKLDLHLNAGIGYYLAKAKGEFRFGSIAAPERWTFDLTGNGLGFHLGAALEYRISPAFGICVELAGRLAGISPFKGSGPFITDFPEGTLYNLDIVAGPLSQKYPLLLVAPPEHMEGVPDSGQAKVDFSGVSLRIGVVIHL